MAKKELILNKPNFSIFISTTELSALQKKALNLFLKTAEVQLKTNKEVQELKKIKKELEEKLEIVDYLKKDEIEKELEIITHNFRAKIGSFYEFKVKVEDVVENIGTKMKDDEYIREEMLKLKELSVEIRKDSKNWLGFVFFPKVKREEDYFIFEVANDLKEQMIMGKGYTPLDLLEMKKLSGIYGIIFYEIMKAYNFRGEIKLEVEEVRKLTGTLDSYNRNGKINFAVWEKYVLKAGIDEINEKTDLTVKYDKRKHKRENKWIEFKIKKKSEFEKSEIKETETAEKVYSEEVEILYKKIKEIEQVASLKDVIAESIELYAIERIESNIRYSNDNAKTNYTAFFKKALKEDYAMIEREKELKKAEIKKKQQQLEEMKKKKEEEEKKLTRKLAEEIYNNLTEEEMEKYEKRFEISLKYVANDVKEILRRRKKENIINMIIENSDILPSSM